MNGLINMSLFKEVRSDKALHLFWYVHDIIIWEKSGIQLSVESNRRLPWLFLFTVLCDWLKKLAPFCQTIRSKNKTWIVTSVAHEFSRAWPCICFEFWLVHCVVRVLCLLRVITFWHLIENCCMVKLDTCDNICDVICSQCAVTYRQDSRFQTIEKQIWVTKLFRADFTWVP